MLLLCLKSSHSSFCSEYWKTNCQIQCTIQDFHNLTQSTFSIQPLECQPHSQPGVLPVMDSSCVWSCHSQQFSRKWSSSDAGHTQRLRICHFQGQHFSVRLISPWLCFCVVVFLASGCEESVLRIAFCNTFLTLSQPSGVCTNLISQLCFVDWES